MTTRSCAKCGGIPCICMPFCPNNGPCCAQSPHTNCAGPFIFTNESRIGSRPCCGGHKKCYGYGQQWCSHDGTCNPPFGGKRLAPPPFTRYYDAFVIKENYVRTKPRSRNYSSYGVA